MLFVPSIFTNTFTKASTLRSQLPSAQAQSSEICLHVPAGTAGAQQWVPQTHSRASPQHQHSSTSVLMLLAKWCSEPINLKSLFFFLITLPKHKYFPYNLLWPGWRWSILIHPYPTSPFTFMIICNIKFLKTIQLRDTDQHPATTLETGLL